MSIDLSSEWGRLSHSAKRVFLLARINADKQSGKPVIDTVDLLVGLVLTHINYPSEIQHLFEHFDVLFEPFLASLGLKKDESGQYDVLALERNKDTPSGFPEMDEDAGSVLMSASGLIADRPSRTDKDGKIHFRILVAGFLHIDSPGLDRLSQALHLNPDTLENVRDNYLSYLDREDIKRKYDQFLKENPIFERIGFSGYVPDDQSNEDFVGIGVEVNAFANMIAAKSLKPPLAIGLFGDWGSGKSFFMKSLMKKVGNITEQARQSEQDEKDISIYKNVIQIEFNAWHYIDGELWASLVEHIFQNLGRYQQGEEDVIQSEIDQRRSYWINQLKNHESAIASNLAKENHLKKTIEAKEIEIAEKERIRDERLEELREVNDVFFEEFKKKFDKENRTKYEKLLRDFGVSPLARKASDFVGQLDLLIENYDEGKNVLSHFFKMRWTYWIGLVLLLFMSPIFDFLVSRFYEVLKMNVSDITQFFSTMGLILGALTSYLKVVNDRVGTKISEAKELKQKLEAHYNEVKKEHDAAIREKERNLEKARQELDMIKSETAKLNEELIKVNTKIDLVPQELLEEFITGRVQSDDYRKHLGIVARVHQDFKRLSSLIDKQNELILGDKPLEGIDGESMINRIVLYIDDLDRCPPKQVIQVLQAVHLLLAFPLFVVVVAVDSRWLSQALQKHYEGLLALPDSDEGTKQAGPRDYLEKIFQIPYWIDPLDDPAKSRIMAGLLKESLSEEDRVLLDSQVANDQQQAGTGDNAGAAQPIIRFAPNQKEDLNPKGLEIAKEEVDFMNQLRSLLPASPRAVKRFVNVYRVAKAMALNFKPNFTSDELHAPYQVVLFTLATLIGLPDLASRLWKAIDRAGGDETFNNLLTALSQDISSQALADELARLNTWLAENGHDHWKTLPVKELKEWGPLIMRFTWSTPFGADW